MNRIREWINSIRETGLPAQERMYRLLVTVGLAALLLVSVVGCIIQEESTTILLLLGGFVSLAIVSFLSFRFKRTDIGIRVIVFVMVFIVVPIGFFAGGIYGGGPIWFVFNFALVTLMLSGRERNVMLVVTFIMTVATYWYAYTHPGLVSPHSEKTAYTDSLTSVIILSCLFCLMMAFQHNAYKQKSRRAEEQKKEILELNRAQNRFFSSMSHEIRTPINTIIGLNEMNLREELSQEVEENSMHIQSASRILLSLINDILDMSRIESGKMTIVEAPYDVGEMLSEVVGMVWSNAKEKGLSFTVQVDRSIPKGLVGDEVRIKQVLINILSNSIKYTETGSVALSIGCVHRTDDKVVLTYSISDTGIGIKKENIPRLFSAFHREDEERNHYIEGTGLGLAIVKQLVDLMGGEITVNSIYTQGSTFVVTLTQPIADEKEIGEINLEGHRSAGRRKAYRQMFEAPEAKVLIVDDNEVNLLVAEKLLRETKVRTETVMSGAEALARTQEQRYDLIFMDHLMPRMDGIEGLHMIRAQLGGMNVDTPVIVLTANAGSDLLAMYQREGFDDCILKPVTGDLLEEGLLAHLPRELVTLSYDESTAVAAASPVLTHGRKRPIIITTESVCDIPREIFRERQVEVLPFSILTQEGCFLDGKEIEADGLLSYMVTTGRVATNRDPTVGEYETFFSECLKKATQIVHITASGRMTGGFANATEATRAFDNVVVFDSGQMSSGMGVLVLYASKLVEEGSSLVHVTEELEKMKARIRTSFVLDNIKYLARAGRVPKHAVSLCEAFMLHPVVTMAGGVMRPMRMMFGNREHVWKRYLQMMFADVDRIDTGLLFITHTGLSMESLDKIRKDVEERIHFDTVVVQKVSAASACVFGTGTFGLIYAMVGDRGLSHIDTVLRERRREHEPIANPQPEVVTAPTKKEAVRKKEKMAVPEDDEITEFAPEPFEEDEGREGKPVEKNGRAELIPEWIRKTRGLDLEAGITYCAGEDGYMAALGIFYSTIGQKADEIERYFEMGDVENYTIKVHALKSSARVIGATALSERALELELAGKDGDTEKIRRETPGLLEEYREYLALLKGLSEGNAGDEDDKEPVPEAVLADAYTSMVEFADQMDYNLMEMVLDSMKEYRLPDGDKKRMEDISKALYILDWDRIRELLSQEGI